jgi:hypothetical protein
MHYRSLAISAALVLCLALVLTPALAQKKAGPAPLTPKESEILLIPFLAKQGYLLFNFDDKGFFVHVEPIFWQKALHREKVELVKAAMETSRFMNKEKHLHIDMVMFLNMTTHEELAYGFIGDLNPGKFEILK